MLLKNNNMHPAFATAGSADTAANSRISNDAIMYNNSNADDFGSFGGFNEENTRESSPARKRPVQNRQAKKKNQLPSWLGIVAVALIAVILIATVIVAVALNSSGNIERVDNAYVAFSEDSQTYRIAANGSVLDMVFESEPIITPALDNSFAYVQCDGEEGILLYILRDKKLEEVTMEGSEITSVVAYAQLKPGIIYEEDGNYYVYTDEMGEDLITKTVDAANFIISDDASTVVYTLPVEDSADEYKMYYYRSGTSDSLGVKNCTPIMLSSDGEYIYGKAFTTALTEKLYCITAKDGEKYPIGDGNFGGITAINANGDELMYYAITDTRYTTYIYNAKEDVSYEISKGKGIFSPVFIDSDVVRYETFKDIYVESISIADMILDTEGAISGHTYYINKKYEAQSIANAVGQFSPNGKYFYYINSRNTLYEMDLSDLDESAKKIYEDTIDFEVTQKGNVYMLNDDNALYYYKASTSTKRAINKITTSISMHDYANKLYYITEDGDVFVTEEGSKGESVKFDSTEINNLPFFSDPESKKTFAYFYNEETALWSIFYTSNGNSFSLITTECESVAGSQLDDLLSGILN